MATISAALSIPFLPSPTRFAVSTYFSPRVKRASRFRCCAEPPSPEQETPAPTPPIPPPGEHPASPSSLWGVYTSTWSAGVAGLGFLETSYLSYLKLTGSEAFCPVGGGGCGDVLDSDYSVIFGIPLPLVGLVAYGLVAALSLQENGKELLPGLDDLDIRLVLLLIATSLATASAYFLFILSTKFVGTSCLYCLSSALISFTLFSIRVKDFGLARIQKFVGLQLAVAVIVALALTNSYSSATTQLKGTGDFVLEPYETEITTESTPFAISLARHLHSIGAKMYGAFWCSHCNEQKQMFGREAMEILDYVECFPNGAGKGKKMAAECAVTGLEGFPTWFINGKVLSGDQELSVLAEASGFVSKAPEQS
ncbi:thiol-disulfide oxidoreductase LTO1 isoform X2 [Brachypodium distachyon]|uniref:thiol-disulfide oxidoreductase LTO1 isoform X2 n=1 Tax=Brachypodium distachyon TaxID=15368 RepID=UPI0001C76DF4|nr:thiol-disulfide oxidoreductase LTO1 isoform X2 [Brachypodium distachyon]|eukprot:XP_003558888.1 thiol-disulfide oxidoreductase LTO1 isoform X2 [Brachypodium distachyon]